MALATNVRSPRQVALLVAIQPTKGTPLLNFSAATVAFSTAPEIPISPEKSEEEKWMAETLASAATDTFNTGDQPEGRIVAPATPAVLDLLLRSNWGNKTGNDYNLKSQINEWLTLAWVEWTAAGNIGKVVRIQDVWVPKLHIHVPYPGGFIRLSGEFRGRKILPDTKGSGGVTLPASFANERNPFTIGDDTTFIKDPAGALVDLRLRELNITLDQNPAPHRWDMGDLMHDVYKAGPAQVRVDFRAEVADEGWSLIQDSRDDVKHQFEFTATTENPIKTLTLTMNKLGFKFKELGHSGKAMREIQGSGRALLDDDEMTLISIT